VPGPAARCEGDGTNESDHRADLNDDHRANPTRTDDVRMEGRKVRTPVPQTPIAQRELTEELADGLAALLVAEFRRRHRPQNQEVLAATVVSRRGHDHLDDEPADREDA